jgi:acetyl esterase/lipase
MYGAYDLVDIFTGFRSRLGRRIAGWMGALVLGTTPQHDPGAFLDASPMSHIDDGDAGMPFLVVHGTIDNLVPVEQSRRFVAQLRDAGADVTYVELAGAPHAFDVFHSTWEHASTTGIEWWLSSVAPVTTPEPVVAVSVERSDGPEPSGSTGGDPATSGPTTMARTAPS